jgi:branched-chain amino acid aminotransferase
MAERFTSLEPTCTGSVQLFALSPAGPLALPVKPGARAAHELFDELALGVYSALRTFHHDRFLRLERHLDRTDRSLELLGWPERLDRPALRRALDQTVRAYPGPDAFVRFDVLAEPARALGTDQRTLLALSPLVAVPAGFLEQGVGVAVSELRRPRPLIKTARFVLERRPYPLGRQDAFEHLLVDAQGRLLEGSSSNFLALRARRLHVTGDEALQGVTQGIVVELARDLGLEVVQAPVRREDAASLDEAFLTGSTRGIVPVVMLDGQRIADGRPGPWTQRLMGAYREFAERESRTAV